MPPDRSDAVVASPLPEARPVRLIRLSRAAHPGRVRPTALAVLVAAAGLAGLARWLRPDPRGLGTHEQLGFRQCGFVFATGLPCPTCGMTTAFSHMAHGQPLAALEANPMGAMLAVGVYLAGAGALVSLVTGRAWTANWQRIGGMRLVIGGLGLLAASWGFKIAWGLAQGTLPIR